MRIILGVAILAGAFFLAEGARAAALAFGKQAAMSRDAATPMVEEVKRYKRYQRSRRYDWTYRPYWRPYQYRYWKFYYPYGGPLC